MNPDASPSETESLLRGLEVETSIPLRFSESFTHDTHACPGFCSIALWGEEGFFCCDYANVHYFDFRRRCLVTLAKPTEGIWNPAGVACIYADGTVFISNYKGHDVLEFSFSEDRLLLKHRYHADGMMSPESVAPSHDGSLVAVADYDGNRLWVFARHKGLAWEKAVELAHGVACGPDSIYVTSLMHRQVIRFSMQGDELRRMGTEGWGAGRFLWPTSLCADENEVLVSDAHTGKLTFLNPDLSLVETIGGNGAETGLFNMPYCAVRQNGKLWVCDTFKQRVLRIGADHRIEWELSASSPQIAAHSGLPEAKIRWGYVDLTCRREVNSPQFPDGLVFPGYGTLKRFDPETGRWTQLGLESAADSIWNPGSFSYFLWMLPVKGDGLDLLATGCVSHTAVYFVDALGRCSMEPFKGPPVMLSGSELLRPDGTAFDISALAKNAAKKFRHHDSIIREKSCSCIEAARICFWPHLKTGEMKKRLQAEFKTAAGKIFWKAVARSASSENATRAASAFDQTMSAQGNVSLPEYWTRNLLVPRKPMQP